MPIDRPAEPWFSFLSELDSQMNEPVDFHCIGGFVLSQLYGSSRETGDLDILSMVPHRAVGSVLQLAGKDSHLHQKHRVYMDAVTVANCPEGYEGRISRVFPIWSKVRLWALEPHDLALSKLERSIERDIRDVIFLAQAGLIDRDTLLTRFEKELEPYLSARTPTWNRSTLTMWIDACWPAT